MAQAAAVIREERPDVVTLNEVCGEDVSVLDRALSVADRGGIVASAFEAGVDRRTGDAVRCRNGQRYGNGLLVRPLSSSTHNLLPAAGNNARLGPSSQ